MHKSLSLTNFTAFEESQFTFVPGVNVLVGANATGKTHLMKLLYAMQKHAVWVASSHEEGPLSAVLAPTFNVERLGRLVRRHVGVQRASIVAEWNHDRRFFGLNTRSKVLDAGGRWRNTTTPVFIPVKDMLAHSRGFGAAYRQRELDYEQVYADILDLAMLPPLRGPIAPNRAALLSAFQKQMRGTVTQKNERFYLNIREGRHQASLEMPLVAEGWRKLALLWLLVQNGSLAEGKVLFWDEPEANLNPPMFAVVADVLHTLAQVGVQVFVATHSYLILQELDLRRRTDVPFQYIVLSRDGAGQVSASTATEYGQISPNLIEAQYLSVYERKVARQLAGG